MWENIEPPRDVSSRGFFIGTGGYLFKDWENRFYPPNAKSKLQKLSHYQQYFNYVEISHTFSEPAQKETFEEIGRVSKDGMQFGIRLHRDISHNRFWDIEQGHRIMKEYIAAVSPLVETGKCFSLLLFVEDKPRSQKRLDYLLAVSSEAVDRRIDVHIAFGHYSWHQHHVLKSLQDAGIGICNAELPLQNAFPLKSYATSEKGYIRYCGAKGMGDHIYSQGDIEERIGGQVELSRKVSHLGIAYCNCFLARAPMNAIQNIHQLNQIFEFSHITGC